MAVEESLLGTIGTGVVDGLGAIGSGLGTIGKEVGTNFADYGKLATGIGGLYLQNEQAKKQNEFANRQINMQEQAFAQDQASAERRRNLRF